MECEGEVPKRQLLRWSKTETLVLLHAKQKIRNGNKQINGSAAEERFSDVNKWRKVSDILRSHGFDRDQVACKKRWFHLLSDYRKIHDWQQQQQQQNHSFWVLQPQERRDSRLPSGFDPDVYKELEDWLGSNPSPPPPIIPAPAAIVQHSEENQQDDPSSSAEVKLPSRKKQKQQLPEEAAEHYDDERLVEAAEKNGRGFEQALQTICHAQIDALKEITRAQAEACKQLVAVQVQQGREIADAIYAMVNAVGELAKSKNASICLSSSSSSSTLFFAAP